MACNCGANKATKNYVYRDESGKEKQYRSEIEANAAKIRNGGRGEVKPV